MVIKNSNRDYQGSLIPSQTMAFTRLQVFLFIYFFPLNIGCNFVHYPACRPGRCGSYQLPVRDKSENEMWLPATATSRLVNVCDFNLQACQCLWLRPPGLSMFVTSFQAQTDRLCSSFPQPLVLTKTSSPQAQTKRLCFSLPQPLVLTKTSRQRVVVRR